MNFGDVASVPVTQAQQAKSVIIQCKDIIDHTAPYFHVPITRHQQSSTDPRDLRRYELTLYQVHVTFLVLCKYCERTNMDVIRSSYQSGVTGSNLISQSTSYHIAHGHM
jgi:hypothetical protein